MSVSLLHATPSGVWVTDLIYLILEGGDVSKADLSLETVEDNVPFLEAPCPGLETLKHLPSPRYIKSHLPYNLLPIGVREKMCKVSLYMGSKSSGLLSWGRGKGNLSPSFQRYIKSHLPYNLLPIGVTEKMCKVSVYNYGIKESRFGILGGRGICPLNFLRYIKSHLPYLIFYI